MTPEDPPDETQRLQVLYSLNILDTPNDERFDRLTRLAKRVFDVPVALVTFIDKERQWVKSCAGIQVGDLPREISFCGHAILGDDVFVIPDMTKDKRFANNPLVLSKETNVRFYAGCPIKSGNGSKLGTLCVLDQKPREFKQEDEDSLRDLAEMVERELSAIELATNDELTGLLNRRGFLLMAENNLKLSVRETISVSLIFFDLNKFKEINDTFGHAAGDRALIEFARHLQNELRESDVYARLGGDEFAGLLLYTNKASAERSVERIRKAVEKKNATSDNPFELKFSHGIIQYDETRHESLQALIEEGDQLMYSMKKNASV